MTRLAKPAAEKPAGHEVARLAKPVAVPRVCPGPTMPFARAWAPCLAGHEIDAAVFLAFVDGLNLVTAPHPAIKLVELAGFCMNFVPLPYADALAAILQVTAVVATVLVARHRGRRYLDRLNADVFEPRGLHVATMGTTKLKARLGIAHDRVLLAPLTDMTLHLSAQERCLLELETWAAALVTDGVPPPLPLGPPQSPPADGSKNGSSGGANVLDGINNMLNRYTSWRIRSAIRKADRSAARGRRRAWKRHLKGKPLKEAWGEKTRVGKLSWIVVRNLDRRGPRARRESGCQGGEEEGQGTGRHEDVTWQLSLLMFSRDTPVYVCFLPT